MSTHEPRNIIVTGGGTGIGRAIALTFATDGDHVIILGRRAEPLRQTAREAQAQTPGATITCHSCDISRPDEIEAFARWLSDEQVTPIDALINNAGGSGGGVSGDLLADTATEARSLLETNLVGVYVMTTAIRPLLRRPGGRIINISSIAAVRGGGGMYSAAKAGVIGLTYALAGELGPEGITVNAIAPGLILDTEFFGDRMTNERLARTVVQIPMGRPGRPADIAAAARYLASPEASYVNGEIHHVNGGWVFGR